MASTSKGPKPQPEAPAVARGPRWIEYRVLSELVPADRNPKLHDLEELKAAFERLGFIDPAIDDARTGKLIAGHGRLEALAQGEHAGLAAPEGVVVGEDGRWQMPVVCGWSSSDDDEAEAALLGLNGIGARAGNTGSVLEAMLTSLAQGPRGLAGTGHGSDAATKLLRRLSAPPALPKQARDLRSLEMKWFLVRVPLHRVAEVAEHMDQIVGVPDVKVSDIENAGGRK